ncbi:oligosaccharide flippase family protein [Halomonas sp. PGE1]|uniref:lipopolysaccharide biosynthesis protein n=1 Tax=Halomonas sp. PGE1 TaxID=2730360 RepID=UPI001472B06E|nr:oligosaccharide flippase family protein [Halomonas sp. PGE1]QJQ99367.1 oligosaccharide flippase family protein [Halomonas sp. PGE1]
MTDSAIATRKKISLASGAMVYLASNILNASIPFLLLPILTRHLEPTEYGQVAMFQVLVSALTAFVGLNAVGAANRKYYDEDARKEMSGYIGACFQILAISFLFVSAFLLLFQDWLAEALGISPIWIFLAAVSSGASFFVKMRLGQWQVRKQPLKYGALQISLSFFNAILSLVLVVALSYGPEGRMAGEIVAPVVLGALAFFLLIKDGLVRFSLRLDQIKDALSFGVPLIPHVGGAFLLSTVDRFVVNKHLGLDSAGVYMVAVQLTMAMSICFDAFNKAYVPWLFERLKANETATKRRIVKWTYTYFIIVLMMAGAAFIIGPYAIILIAGEKYAAAGTVIGILALGQAFQGMYLMVTNYIFFAKKTARLSMVTIFSGVLNVGLLMLLIPILGLQGAAIAFVIAMAIRFVSTWWLANISHPMPWFDFKRVEG